MARTKLHDLPVNEALAPAALRNVCGGADVLATNQPVFAPVLSVQPPPLNFHPFYSQKQSDTSSNDLFHRF
jgi:hypothetical protein